MDDLPIGFHGDAVVPQYLTAADEPWLTLLLAEYERFTGKRKRELEEHLRTRLPFDAPPVKLRLVRSTLQRLWRTEVRAAVSPRQARTRSFVPACGRPADRDPVLAQVASELAITAADLDDALFADLPGERRLVAPEQPLSASELGVRANLRMVQSLLMRSANVRLRLEGNARPVIRHAKWCGLICTVVADEASQSVRIDISGPLSLFNRTLVYGRALAQLVPRLTWCNRFFLDADVALEGGPRQLILGSGAPIFPGEEPRRFDSKLEERFARDFCRTSSDWDLIREPEPISIGRGLIFPDFALTRRRPPFERWFLEIVGFWTADYLERKLASYRLAGLERLILCIDSQRQCSHEDLPARARIIRFKKKIDPENVLKIIT